MTVPFRNITTIGINTLYVLDWLDSPNGIDVKAALEAAGYDDLASSTVYDALESLVDDGLVEKNTRHGQNRYRLTYTGKRRLKDDREWRE